LAGITGLTYIFTWQNMWHDIGWSNTRHDGNYQEWGIWFDSAITLGLALAWALTAVKTLQRNSLPSLILCSFPLLACAAFFFASTSEGEIINTLLFNAYMLALGLALLAQGCRSTQLRQVNYGMAVLGLLLITRFFDSDFGFLARGLVFILMGSCFLATNLIIARKKHQQQEAQS